MKIPAKILLLGCLQSGVVFFCNAQTNVGSAAKADSIVKPAPVVRALPPKPKGPVPIHAELSLGFRLNTNGWGAYMEKGKVKSSFTKQSDIFYDVNFWMMEFDEKKDAREAKTTVNSTSSYGSKTNSFIYGKINNFYAFKIGLGFRKMIAGKPDPGTVSIHWVGAGGLAAGLLKPYYLDVYSNGSSVETKYTDQTRDAFLNADYILGSSGFTKGLDEIKIIPGAHIKTGLHFDFASSRKTVIAAEAGVNAEYYTQDVPIMASQKAVPYFFNLYASFQIGKRW